MSKRKDILSSIKDLTFTGFATIQRSIGLVALDKIETTLDFPLLEIVNGNEVHTPATNQQLSGELTVLMAITVTNPKPEDLDEGTDPNDFISNLMDNLMDTVFEVMNENETMKGNALSTVLTETKTEREIVDSDTFQRAVMTFTIKFDVIL